MIRRVRMAVLAAVFLMVLMMLAASSGPVRIWLTPSSDSLGDGGGRPDTIDPQQPVPADRIELPTFVGTVLQLLAVLVAVLAVAMALAVVTLGHWPQLRWRRQLDRRDRNMSSLPEVRERTLKVDVDLARAALSGGTPRNAIVACWMQLESDAAEAGLPRLAAETPAEYVERVVGASSVDPVPIGELAALYREARFSRHELRDDHRERAFAALDRVEATLRRGVEVPA